jgi:hypothetical protein
MIDSGNVTVGASGALPAGAKVMNNGSLVIGAGSAAAPVVAGQITGSGALTVGTQSKAAYLLLSAGSGTVSQSALTINPGSTLDITTNTLTINYGSAANDPVQAIRADLASAYDGGTWAGTGLTSSIAEQNPTAFTVGYADNTQADRITVMLTVPGDANLDGQVTFADLVTIAQHFGSTGIAASWINGDLNYDGKVNFTDLLMVAANFNDSLTKAEAANLPASMVAQWNLAVAETANVGRAIAIPEPVTGSMIAGVAGMLLVRRPRRT